MTSPLFDPASSGAQYLTDVSQTGGYSSSNNILGDPGFDDGIGESWLNAGGFWSMSGSLASHTGGDVDSLTQGVLVDQNVDYRLSVNFATISDVIVQCIVTYPTGGTLGFVNGSSAGWQHTTISITDATGVNFTIGPNNADAHVAEIEEVIFRKYLW